jgi:glycosyltransferase involved in cell wall biosynthesis
VRFLHLHSSFHPGGKELRAVRLMNAFGGGIEHAIVSGVPEALGAASAIDPEFIVSWPEDFPPLSGAPTPGRLQRLAKAMRGFDLVLTYNWGAMDAVMAHTLFRDRLRLPPLVHHEDGFNEDEARALKQSRNWYRRIALGRASALVAPSRKLEAVALEAWQQPRARVTRIANGIDTSLYSRRSQPDALPRIVKRPGEKWLGTIAGLRAVKNLPRLVRVFSGLGEEWQLVIAGEGPAREAIRAEALRLGLSHRVHLPGFVVEPAKAVGLFDLFALSSESEQFPISVVEAMAGGLAVASPEVGDVAEMVSPANRPFLSAPGDEAGLAQGLARLAGDERLRAEVGRANRERARAEYDEKPMIAAYRALYARAMGLPDLPGARATPPKP